MSPAITFDTHPSAPLIEGRALPCDDGMRYSWSGTGVTVRFRGTELSADLTDNGNIRYCVQIDGTPSATMLHTQGGRSLLSLARGLSPGPHTITLYRQTEPREGATTLHGFVLDASGQPLAAPPPATRQIVLIGDSISAGYGNLSPDPECDFSPDTEDHFESYGARAARALHAGLTTLAWSGKGAFSNRGKADEKLTMTDLWSETDPTSPGNAWPAVLNWADVVLINLGSNDYSPDVVDPSGFAPAMRRLVNDVRHHHPDAHIYLLLGPLLRDDSPHRALSSVRHVLQKLVRERSQEGDARLHLLEFPPVTPEEGWGAKFHPSLRTHARMATQLQLTLAADLAWDEPPAGSGGTPA